MTHRPHSGPFRRHAIGITLVEAMVCLLIVAALSALAAPGFRDALARERVAAVRGELTSAMQWARWEALRRNTPVSLRRRNDCTTLLHSPSEWHCGWRVVIAGADEEQTLQVFALPSGVRLVHASGGATVQFGRSGVPSLVAHKFVIGHSLEVTAATTALCMNRTGRVRTVTGTATC